MKKNLYFAFALFSFLACKQTNVHEIRNANGVLVQRITIEGDTTMGKNGTYEFFNQKGQLTEISIYRKGLLEGERKIYENGQLYSSEFHKNDLYDGPYKVYYPNGTLQLETQYVNNEMIGELRAYYPSGKLKEIVQMKESQEEGPFHEFYENGNKKADGNYKGGPNEDGLLILYDSTGTLIRKMECKEGICNTIWKADSTLSNSSNK